MKRAVLLTCLVIMLLPFLVKSEMIAEGREVGDGDGITVRAQDEWDDELSNLPYRPQGALFGVRSQDDAFVGTYSLAPGGRIRQQDAFHLDRPSNAGVPGVARIRWLASNAGAIDGQLSDLDSERIAVQSAIWAITGTIDLQNSPSLPADVTLRALELVEISSQAGPGTGEPYPTSYSLVLEGRDDHAVSVDLLLRLTTGEDRPVADEVITVDAEYRDATTAEVTDSDGRARVSVAQPPENTTLRAEWSRVLPSGLLLAPSSARQPWLVTAQGLPVSAERKVELPAMDHLQAIRTFSPDVLNQLSEKGRIGVLVLALFAGLAIIGLFIFAVASKISGSQWAVTTRNLFFGLAPAFLVLSLVVAYFQWDYRPTPVRPVTVTGGDLGNVDVLIPQAAGASSIRSAEQYCYGPALTYDGDVTTAWVSRRSAGAGQRLSFRFRRPVLISELQILNGLYRSYDAFLLNGRATAVRLFFDSGVVLSQQLQPDLEPDRFADQPYFSWKLEQPEYTWNVILEVARFDDRHASVAISELRFLGREASQSEKRQAAGKVRSVPGLHLAPLREGGDDGCGVR